jgi:hypothetical protein
MTSSGAFPLVPRSYEPAGGTILIDNDNAGCTVHVRFLFPDGKACGELPRRIGPVFDLTYRVCKLNATAFHKRVLDQAQVLISNRTYCGGEKAFHDALDLKVALVPFVEVGRTLFVELFGLGLPSLERHFDSDLPSEDLQIYGECLRAWLKATTNLTLAVRRGGRGYLPWNVLYTGDLPSRPEDVDPQGFWGFGKQVQILSDGLCDFLDVRASCHVSAGIEDLDEGVRAGADVHRENTHPFKTLPSGQVFVSGQLDDVLKEFGASDLLYFFGHASGSLAGLEFASISLNGTSLTAPDLKTWVVSGRARLPSQRPVLVFLNGCSTQVGTSTDTITDALIQLKSRSFCFVSTIATVPDWAGARFACEFLRRFLDGASLGLAMSEARCEMLARHLNPVGLFYAAYGKLGTRIRQ